MIIKDFKGSCKGVRLTQRGVNDKHICIQILTEDDGNWFVDGKNSFSTSWMEDLQEQLELAKSWMGTQIPDMGTEEWQKNIQYGWRFK